MAHARLIGAGHFVPTRIITNERIVRAIPGWTAERIVEKTGIVERRFLWDFDTETGVSIAPPEDERLYPISNSDMCEVAVRGALEMADVSASSVDALVLVTCTPDELNFSHDAMELHRRLGMRRDAYAMVLDDGCGGTPYVIDLVKKWLASGALRTVVVAASAFTSPLVNRRTYTSEARPSGDAAGPGLNAFLSMYVFGDGAGAVVLRGDEGTDGRIVSSMAMNSHEELVFRRGGGALKHLHQGRARDSDLAFIVNGPLVARSYPRMMGECVTRALDGAGLAPHDIARFYFHQPNKRVMDLFVGELGLERERVAMNVERYGNTSAAGMLVLLSEDLNEGKVAFGRGEPVLLAAVGANVHGGGQVVVL